MEETGGTSMAAAYMHIGIPVTNKKPGMVYNEGARFWVSSVDDYDYKIEYLKFEEGTPFPRSFTAIPMWRIRWTIFKNTSNVRILSSAVPWTPTTRAISWPLSGRTERS